jgi:hypothetical protein
MNTEVLNIVADEDFKIITLSQTYQVDVKEVLEEETESKKEKTITHSFLVEAYSVTDAEVKINKYYSSLGCNFKIASVKFSKIIDILS